MPRYFLEVRYKGAAYKGFQIQSQVPTIQGEVTKALEIILRSPVRLTTSSRTDAGVHALQNFFHFNTDLILSSKMLYNVNAILPKDIAAVNLYEVDATRHSRYSAESRVYQYYLYSQKNPFLTETAWYYPYFLDKEKLQQAADILKNTQDFASFRRRGSNTRTTLCAIKESVWIAQNDCLIYRVEANRFLRGMVRGLVGMMLKVGRGHLSQDDLQTLIDSKTCAHTDFSTPPQGLFLMQVKYPFPLTAVE